MANFSDPEGRKGFRKELRGAMKFRDLRLVRTGLQLWPRKLSGLILASLAPEQFRPLATGLVTEFGQISGERKK